MKPILDAVESIEQVRRRGMLFILSSPSGAGKTTLAKRLMEADPDVTLSVSATTRQPREGEVNGVDYHFVDKDEFAKMVVDGEMLEHATVFDNYYGSPRAPVEKVLSEGRDVLFDVDWQGAQQIRDSMKEDVVSVFIRWMMTRRSASAWTSRSLRWSTGPITIMCSSTPISRPASPSLDRCWPPNG